MKSMNEELIEIGRLAVAFDDARAARSTARACLAKLRRQWLAEGGDLYCSSEHRHYEGGAEMEAAIAARDQAQRNYTAAIGKLRRAITKAKWVRS